MKTIFPQDALVKALCRVTVKVDSEAESLLVNVPVKGHKAGMNLHKAIEEHLIGLYGGNLVGALVISVVGDFK